MSAANDYSQLVSVPDAGVVDREPNGRERVLSKADDAVNNARNATYGDPNQDFQRTANYWNTHLNGVLERKLAGMEIDVRTKYVLAELIDTWDVAIMLSLLKASRLAWSPNHEDNWVDLAGYAACGNDCVRSHFAGKAES